MREARVEQNVVNPNPHEVVFVEVELKEYPQSHHEEHEGTRRSTKKYEELNLS